MNIPYQAIHEDTLRNMIEEYVTRNGTDYGEQEQTLETKVAQVLALLKAGDVAIHYDESLEICEIVMVKL